MKYYLSLLLALSLFLRSFLVTSVPPELFGDEIDVGYQAYSLLKTGKDLYNQPLPTYIHSLAEWRMPTLIYATIPSVLLFGLTELGVRLPQILFGSLAPIILFLLVYQLTKSKPLAVLSAISLALLPWHIHYSRVAFEVVLLVDLIMLGALLFVRKNYLLSIIFFSLSLYTYSTALIFVPLLALFLVLYTRRLPSVASIITGLVFVLPLLFNLIAGPARGRFELISVFSDPQLVKQITESRSLENSPLAPIWYNRPVSLVKNISTNYFRAFSTDFLFIRGDPIMRHSFQFIGHIYPLFAPFLLLGLFKLFKNRHYFWLFWLILAPLPSSLTSDGGFHATRLFLMVPPLSVSIGYGLNSFTKLVSSSKYKYLVFGISILLFSLHFIYISHHYLVNYPRESWRWWHTGFKSVYSQLPSVDPNYSRVFINNTYEPALIRFLFYTAYNPVKFHKSFTTDKLQPSIVPGFDGFTLDGKYYFGKFTSEPVLLPGSLYVLSQRDDIGGDWDWRKNPPANTQALSASVDPTGLPILYLVTRK